jgi:hypothetical protein
MNNSHEAVLYNRARALLAVSPWQMSDAELEDNEVGLVGWLCDWQATRVALIREIDGATPADAASLSRLFGDLESLKAEVSVQLAAIERVVQVADSHVYCVKKGWI